MIGTGADTAGRVPTGVGNILVVKIGGGAGVDWAACAADIARTAQNRAVMVVHGVSDALDRLCAARGVPVRTLVSPGGHASRYTDPVMRDLYVEAAAGVNVELVGHLRACGASAVGFSRWDTPIAADRKTAIRAVVDGRVLVVRDDHSGSIAGVNADPLWTALHEGLIPVIAPLARSDDGLLNVDGDRAAAAVACTLGASDLVILSNVRGLYRQFGDESSFVDRVSGGALDDALEWAQGRMKRKVLGARAALEGGVRRVTIADGRSAGALGRALAGEGTVFVS